MVPPGRTWCRREGRGAAGKDVVPPGRTWCRREGRGAAGKDVVPPGRTWCRREGRGAAGKDVAGSTEGRQRPQRVGTFTRRVGSVHRGSALSPGGSQRPYIARAVHIWPGRHQEDNLR